MAAPTTAPAVGSQEQGRSSSQCSIIRTPVQVAEQISNAMLMLPLWNRHQQRCPWIMIYVLTTKRSSVAYLKGNPARCKLSSGAWLKRVFCVNSVLTAGCGAGEQRHVPRRRVWTAGHMQLHETKEKKTLVCCTYKCIIHIIHTFMILDRRGLLSVTDFGPRHQRSRSEGMFGTAVLPYELDITCDEDKCHYIATRVTQA